MKAICLRCTRPLVQYRERSDPVQHSSFRGICSQMPELERCTGSLRSRYCTHACCASRYGIASQPSAKPGQFDSGCGEIESSMLLPLKRFTDSKKIDSPQAKAWGE